MIYVRLFSPAKVKCMKDVFLKPDHVFLKVGTNDLASENNAERIAKSIVDLAKKFLSKITVLLAYLVLYLEMTESQH